MPNRMTEEITVRLSRPEIEAAKHLARYAERESGLTSPEERSLYKKLHKALASQPEHSEEAGNCGGTDKASRDDTQSVPDQFPEPGSDAEVAERLRAEADGPLRHPAERRDLLRKAAGRLLARPLLDRDDRERLQVIADELEMAAAKNKLHPDLANRDARFLRTLAAKSDQENPDA